MHTGLLHTHKLVVTLFLLHYLIKTILLLAGKKETLQNYSAKTKIAEMVISVLFLLTGGYLLMQAPTISKFTIYKLIMIFASIPLAVIGFKKQNKMLALLSLILIIGSYGMAEVAKKHKADVVVTEDAKSEDPLVSGKAIYEANCIICHGKDGKAGVSGAKDLTTSTLSDDEKKNIIANGKNAMAAYKNTLNEKQISNLVQYINTLK